MKTNNLEMCDAISVAKLRHRNVQYPHFACTALMALFLLLTLAAGCAGVQKASQGAPSDAEPTFSVAWMSKCDGSPSFVHFEVTGYKSGLIRYRSDKTGRTLGVQTEVVPGRVTRSLANMARDFAEARGKYKPLKHRNLSQLRDADSCFRVTSYDGQRSISRDFTKYVHDVEEADLFITKLNQFTQVDEWACPAREGEKTVVEFLNYCHIGGIFINYSPMEYSSPSDYPLGHCGLHSFYISGDGMVHYFYQPRANSDKYLQLSRSDYAEFKQLLRSLASIRGAFSNPPESSGVSWCRSMGSGNDRRALCVEVKEEARRAIQYLSEKMGVVAPLLDEKRDGRCHDPHFAGPFIEVPFLNLR